MTDKIVAIVGPTASGKTDLAMQLASRYPGEIICADSRTIYRGMDIGTAKPTAQERRAVRHHLLDIIDPGEALSAAAFKRLAEGAIADVWERGLIAYVVGGSGLYVDALLFDYKFPEEADPNLRARLDVMTDEQLLELLAAEDPEAYERVDLANRRRVIRAIETAGQPRSRSDRVRADTLLLGLTLNKEIAQQRISQRVQKMLEKGFLDEVRTIGSTYGWDSPALDVIGYRAFKEVALGQKTADEGAADFVRGDMALYKKQLTWFRRNPHIHWLQSPDEAEAKVAAFLGR
jgi:tRNA dimethylallyltransferase